MSIGVRYVAASAVTVIVAAPSAMAGSWYGGAFVGAAFPEDIDYIGTTLEADTTFGYGGFIGNQFGESIRGEVEVSYWGSDLDCPGKCGALDFEVGALSVLGNLWLDIPTDHSFKPYIGGGIGAGEITLESQLPKENEWGFAYQLGVGARFAVGSAMIDVGYRYKGISADIATFDVEANAHQVQLGVVFGF